MTSWATSSWAVASGRLWTRTAIKCSKWAPSRPRVAGSSLDEALLRFNLLAVQKLGVWLKPSCRIWYFRQCTIARKSYQHQNRQPASNCSSTTRCPPKLRIPPLHFRSLPAKGNRSSPSSIPCAPSKEEPKTPLLFHSTNLKLKPSKPQLRLQNKTETALRYSTTEALSCSNKI